VGAGQMAQHHADSIRRLGTSASLVAVCDPQLTAAQALANAANGTRAYGSLAEAIDAEALDVVHVCTPPASHVTIATEALRAGCHVYIEKPFTDSLSTTTQLLTLAAEGGRHVCSGHQLLFERPTQAVTEFLPFLGKLRHVESYFSFRALKRLPDGRAPLRDDLQFLDILPHPVYLLLHFLKAGGEGPTEITSVSAGKSGTVHVLLRRGTLTGTLVVTIEGRPVDSYLRVVGTNGSLHADFVRSTVQRHIGPGNSGIDKLLSPYRQAWQLIGGTTVSMARRFLHRQRSYPGLTEIFDAFYKSILGQGPSPVPPESIIETVDVCERIAEAMASAAPVNAIAPANSRPKVVVTGGTGLLGREVVRQLVAEGAHPVALGRREPAPWDRIPGAEYAVVDLARPLATEILRDAVVVMHCAAETAGGWGAHQLNSIDATRHLLEACGAAGVERVIHVSSLSVMAGSRNGELVGEASPLESDPKALGPYAWGKIESERLCATLCKESGIELRILRPGALVDYREFDPPGLLGKRLANLFVAIGRPSHPLAVADLAFSARSLIWMWHNFKDAPPILHLMDPAQPSKADLLARLRATNPDLAVIWLPPIALVPLSWLALVVQKVLRPTRPAINVAKTFARQEYDYSLIARLAPEIIRSVGSDIAGAHPVAERPIAHTQVSAAPTSPG